MDSYKEGQRILERQRFQFPTTWLYSDNIEGEWGAFSDILKRKDSSIQTQVASLQMKIVSEDKVLLLWWWCCCGVVVVVVLLWWCCSGGVVVVVLRGCCCGVVVVELLLWCCCFGVVPVDDVILRVFFTVSSKCFLLEQH